MHRKVFLALAMVCGLATVANAAAIIDASDGGANWVMSPGTANNPISVAISGGDTGIQGLSFRLGIGDQSSVGQPTLTSVDIIGAGTIFNGNNTGQNYAIFPAPPGTLAVNTTTTTAAGFVTGTGTLANVTIDVGAGVAPGLYTLSLSLVAFPISTTVAPGSIETTLINGTIEVVPEPASIVLGLFAAGGLCAVAIRRRRRKAA